MKFPTNIVVTTSEPKKSIRENEEKGIRHQKKII